MREEETIDERVYRILSKSELTPKVEKPAIIPLIPSDGKGADRIINHISPSESSGVLYFEAFRGVRLDEESRSDFDSGEYEDFAVFRDDDISMEAFMELDHYRLGYDPEEIVHASKGNSPQDSSDVRGYQEIASDDSSVHQTDEGNVLTSKERNSQTDCGHPIFVVKVSRTVNDVASVHSMESERGRVEIMKNDSVESDVSSVISATSTIISSPNILRLKARKRRLERFLSEKSFESRINRRALIC